MEPWDNHAMIKTNGLKLMDYYHQTDCTASAA